MSSAQTAIVQPSCSVGSNTEIAALKEQVQTLQTQLDWFKRQLFGAKSEKRLEIDPAMQADLLAALGEDLPTPVKPETEKIIYERRKLRSDKTVTDTGLRFDDSVPVETMVLSSPELADVPEDEQVLITEKITYRLAQRPGSYVVLKYVRPVITGQRPGQKHRRCQLSGNGVMNNASVMTCCPVTRSPRPSNMPWPELIL